MPGISKYKREEIKELVNQGLCAPSMIMYKDVFDFVCSKINQGSSKTNAVVLASDEFNISKSYVFKILKESF